MWNRDRFHFVINKHIKVWDVSAYNWMYKNQNLWCNHTSPISSLSSSYPIQLSPGMLLICGDKAWPAIPSHIKSCPCILGRFTMLTPNITMAHKKQLARLKRSVHQFAKDRNDKINYSTKTTEVAISALLPWAAAAKT